MSPLAFFVQQIMWTGLVQTLVWLCGLSAGVVRPKHAMARAFSIAWLLLLFVFDLSHGKAYYLSAMNPTLLAFGAVRIEEWLSERDCPSDSAGQYGCTGRPRRSTHIAHSSC